MGFITKLLLLISLPIIIFSCGSKLDYELKNGLRKDLEESVVIIDESKPGNELRYVINEVIPNVNGAEIDISDDLKRSTVLIFASDTCKTCNEEALEILEFIKNREMSLKVNLISIMVGVHPEDAYFWVKTNEISWKVGLDPNGVLIKKYCTENKVPCIIVNDPKTGITLRHLGKIKIEKLEEYTGVWF